jgi:hypothetical protein
VADVHAFRDVWRGVVDHHRAAGTEDVVTVAVLEPLDLHYYFRREQIRIDRKIEVRADSRNLTDQRPIDNINRGRKGLGNRCWSLASCSCRSKGWKCEIRHNGRMRRRDLDKLGWNRTRRKESRVDIALKSVDGIVHDCAIDSAASRRAQRAPCLRRPARP